MSVRRRYLVPEVVQTSAMDCGPAVMRALLAGFGLHVRYERLREACQTDVDGTAIGTLERLLPNLGLEVEQVLVPLDHVLQPQAGNLPAIVVTSQPGGYAHFVVAWRRHGPWVQVMDPASGRCFLTSGAFEKQLYVHTERVTANAWHTWALGPEFIRPLCARLRAVGLTEAAVQGVVRAAREQPGWRPLAALDAAARLVIRMRHGRHGLRAREAGELVCRLWERASESDSSLLPAACWCVQPDAPVDAKNAETPAPADALLAFRGAVLLRVVGKRDLGASKVFAAPTQAREPLGLSAATCAHLSAPEPPLWRRLGSLLDLEARRLTLAAMLCALAGGFAIGLEALLWNAIVAHGLWHLTALDGARALLAALGLLVVLATLEGIGQWAARAAGRRFEARLRSTFQRAAPRLGERLLRGRLRSDLAERSHAAFALRELPGHLASGLLPAGELVATLVAMGWLFPSSLAPAALTAAVALVVPLLAQSWLAERDLRMRTHVGALARFQLDALLGLLPLRAHRGARALTAEHDRRLDAWLDAGLALQRATVWGEFWRGLLTYGLVAWIVWAQALHATMGVLLCAYWALRLPELGTALAMALAQWPRQRSLLRRLVEPLDELPEADLAPAPPASVSAGSNDRPGAEQGVTIDLRDVGVQIGGRALLSAVTLHVRAGEQVAILGASGAGKSTLVGLLLGLHTPTLGSLHVDERSPTAADWLALRARTAWVDPDVHLWRSSLYSNLRFGAADPSDAAERSLPEVLGLAQLEDLVAALPHGLETALGEGGALVSGGEGQRVRFGRALLRVPPRLVLLDEAFRGLPREQRQAALARARTAWPAATFLIVTHDVALAQTCDRVLVVEQGRIVENGAPVLLAQADTRWATWLASERALTSRRWADPGWRRWRVAEGHVYEPVPVGERPS